VRFAVIPLVVLAAAGCSGSGARTTTATPAPAPSIAPAPSAKASVPACDNDFGNSATKFSLERAALMTKPGAQRLLTKLDASAYKYFRALGPQYALRTCAAFRDVRWHLPISAIHGDAHVEQFVVTPSTAGVEDFDQSGFGPAIVDIVRYAASIHLACREMSWPCKPDVIVEKWLDAYRETLDKPPTRKTPAVTERIRANTPTAADAWLKWADGLMMPLPKPDEERARKGWAEFRKVQLEIDPKRTAAFYDVVKVGALQMGIGSALETKLLFRIRGSSDVPTDDIVVEARSSMPAVAHECSSHPLHGGTLWPLMFMSILGPRMPDVYGFATLADDPAPEFWVQSWVPGYRELAISDVKSEEEMIELAEDAARQLAGHFWVKFPEPLRVTQRHAQLQGFDLTRDRARKLARDFAAETVEEWQRFRGNPK
jgi:hypothetical protein